MHKTQLSVGLALLGCLTAATVFAAPAVYGERASVKVRPSHAVRDDNGVDLTAARNEFAAFQVVVHGAAAGATGVSATMGALTAGSSTINANRMTLYRETLLNVTQPSGTAGSTGMWPDGLVPDIDEIDGQKRKAFPFDVPANQARALWVDIHVPDDATPGTYTGAVTVSGAGFTHQVPVKLTVVNATLPSTSSLPSAFLIYGGTVCGAHTGSTDCAGSTTVMAEHLNRYEQLALDHRITLTNIFKVGRQGDSWSTFDAMYTKYLEGTAPTRLVGAKMTTAQLTSNREVAKYKLWADHFKTKGWFDRLFDYTGDEPPYGITFVDAKARATATKAADPALRTLLTTNITDLNSNGAADLFDTVVPVVNFMDGTASPFLGNQRAKYDSWLTKPNKQLWMYQSCMSHGCAYGTNLPENTPGSGWPSYMVDRSAAKNRAMQWLVFKYDATGELYYETALALQTAWTNQFQFAGNGDGTLFYPGTPSVIGGTTHVPLPSIRLKQIRLGMQDYEWLKLVADAGDPGFARQIVNGLIPAASKVSDDGAAFDAARLQLIRRYVELKGPAQPPVVTNPQEPVVTVPPTQPIVPALKPSVDPSVDPTGETTPTTTEAPTAVEQPMWTETPPGQEQAPLGDAKGNVGCNAAPTGSLAVGLLALLGLSRRRRS